MHVSLHRSNRLLYALLITISVCNSPTPLLAAADEFRAMWVSRYGSPVEWVSSDQVVAKGKIDDIMTKLGNNNFNAVVFQLRGQADCLYYSPYEPYSPLVSTDGARPPGWTDFDPVAYAIKAARSNGLEFHAYLNGHVAWGGSGKPTYCGSPTDRRHLYWEHCNVDDAAHRDWLLCNSSGTPLGYDGSEYVWIAPGIPAFQAYWRKQIMYMVMQYDGSDPETRPALDGVHFDRCRVPNEGYSYDPISQARRLGDGNPAGLSFADWQRDQFTRVLCDLYAEINEYTQNLSPTHHRVKVSSAPLGMHSGSRYTEYGYPTSNCGYGGYGYSCKYQDPQSWMAAGAMDFIVPQIYWADPTWRASDPHYSEILPDWLQHNSGRHVYPGINTSATGPGLVSEVNVERSMCLTYGNGNQPGTTVWSYSTFNNNNYWTNFSSPGGPYEEPANVPAMPWKDNPTDAIILGTVTDGTDPITDVNITRTGSTYVALSSADGLYSFLKVPPGTYTLTYTKTGYAVTTREVTVVAGQVLRVPEVSMGGPVISNVQATNVTNNTATITWTTNIAADSQVQYGTTAAYGSTSPLNPALVTAHTMSLTGLSPKTLYHYRVVSTADGLTSYSVDYTFTTGGPPVISNVQSGSITSSGATITWTTDVASTSQVAYGLTSSYGSQTPLDSTLVTSHSVAITGLLPGTTYHYQARSTNGYLPDAQSSDLTFTTLSVPPVISNIQAGSLGDATATITWTTNVGATSQVQYGLTTSYGQTTTLDSNLVTAHTVNLTGLFPGTLYHYRVISSVGGSSATSGDFTFTTTGMPSGPVISSVASGSWDAVTSSSLKVTITWTTNIAADSQVEYGLTTSYGSVSTLDPTPATSHSVQLSGLNRNTTYHFRVRSTGGGATSYSSDYSFLSPFVVDNTDSGWSQSGTVAWKTGSAGGVPKVGSNYLYSDGTGTSGSPTAISKWTPSLTVSGFYDVYVGYQIGSNRNESAPVTVVHADGQTPPVPVNQNGPPNSWAWTRVGTNLPFNAGTGGYVQVGNDSTDTKFVSADAAMFLLVAPDEPPGDTEPPSIPTNLQATAASTTSIQLSWTASTDNVAVSGYKIYRGGSYVTSVTTTSYLDAGRTANTSYSYEVSAYDAASNESTRSNSVSRATLSIAPAAGSITPDNATSCTGSSVTWTAVGGFGAGKVQSYRYAWDQNATHTFTAGDPVWSSGTIATPVSAAGTWYLHVQGYNLEAVPNGTFDYTIQNPCRAITHWRSVRQHGASSLAVELDADATGNGLTGPTVEPRTGGIQQIELDFDGPVTAGNAAAIQVTGVTTTDGVLGTAVSYTPSSVSLADADTLVITFDAGVLPDATCYTVTIGAGAIVETLTTDADCSVRALAGDATGNGVLNLGDAILTRLQAGPASAANAGYDLDLSGTIDAADVQTAKAGVASPARSCLVP